MVGEARFCCFFIALAFAATALGQGSAGGYGQGAAGGQGGGGMGGGVGGGMGAVEGRGFRFGAPAAAPDQLQMPRPESDASEGLWETRTAVLTPGDRVEYKLKVQKGETVLAGVTSDAFDPALSIVDATGNELFKNDDRDEGDQSPFAVYRFADAGTYTLKVLSYRSVSGGKFTLKMRSFVAADVELGKFEHDASGITYGDAQPRIALRIHAIKGHVYDLRSVLGVAERFTIPMAMVSLLGPTGVTKNDYAVIQTADSAPVFKALTDGDFYAEYRWTAEGNGVRRFTTDVHDVAVTQVKDSSDEKLTLEPGELRVVEFPVQPKQIVRTSIVGVGFTSFLAAPALAGVGDEPGRDAGYGATASWAWFKPNVDADQDVVRVFRAAGTARLALRSQSGAKVAIEVKNTESLPPWTVGPSAHGDLAIGESKLFLVNSTKSELMRVFAGASHFQPRLDIFRLDGVLANSLCNRVTHTAADDLYFPDADTFIVRLSCDGHGGSGAFDLAREFLKASPYALGTVQTLKLQGGDFGLYEVHLEAGKRYELMTDQPNVFMRADLLDEDGQFLISSGVAFDKVLVQYFTPTKSGVHRLWLRGPAGVRHFKFQLNVPPTLGP